MKKITFIIGIIILCVACSSSKMTTSKWLADDFNNQPTDKVLIYASTPDIILQKEFENETAQVLSDLDITIFKMHDTFPDVMYKEERTQEEIAVFLKDCKEKQINKILFASKKSQTVDTVMSKSLHNYMNDLHALSIEGYDDDLEYETDQVTTYVIEAAVYDINKTSKDAPVATTSITAMNPKSLDDIKTRLLKSIKQIFKK
ncbi:hypothetical protein JCM19275_1583 [Nonlabens ulvanivorans]|uniref:Uncharacterized protein n=1 Tax=Nonlabens ulvanivorans TaxID=906888 RepID=A0A090WF98_NONUL|nr:hypothetical protein [Nonlabens ulvanivorans]GAL75700.1 hypothetical protein JCM19275_1583 [Nonlabens ulvanivorans]